MVWHMKTWTISLFLIAFFTGTNIYADESKGTLIVTYKTDRKGERLDRTHFWLKKDGERLGFYPKGSFFIEDRKEMSRMIVIDNLPSGTYQLQFLIPNLDGYFEQTPIREIAISEGEIFKIDQKIRRNEQPKIHLASQPRGFGSLIISYDWDKTRAQHIAFRLTDSLGKTTVHPRESDMEISMDSGMMVHIPKIESDCYKVEFFSEDKVFRSLHTLEKIEVSPDTTLSIHEELKF